LTQHLESHLVWPVRGAEAEAGGKVVDEVSLLLDVGQKSLVDSLLVLNAVLSGLLLLSHLSVLFIHDAIEAAYLGLLALLEESILARLVSGLVLGEVAVLASLLQDTLIDTLDVDGGGGSNDIAGVDSSQRNTVDFERTGNEEDTLGQVLEENDALAAETTSEEDDDGTGLEGGTGLRRASSLTGLEFVLVNVRGLRLAACRSSAIVACSRRAVAAAMRPCPPLPDPPMLSRMITYLLGDGDVLSRVVLAGLLRVVRYRPLALGELLGRGFGVRHFELLVSLVSPGELFGGRVQ
jgi:hypothetical protein